MRTPFLFVTVSIAKYAIAGSGNHAGGGLHQYAGGWSARHSAADNAMPGFRRGVMRLASLGYAVPGTILAIGFLTPAMAVDRWLADLLMFAACR